MIDQTMDGAEKMISMYAQQDGPYLRECIERCLNAIGYAVVKYGDDYVAVPSGTIVFPHCDKEAK